MERSGRRSSARRYGEDNDFPVLPWAGFTCDAELVAGARIVAAAVLDADGLWTDPMDEVESVRS